MDKLDAALTGGREAQLSVIGSMLIDARCIPLVLSRMTPDDFVDGTCRATFQAIRKLTTEVLVWYIVTELGSMVENAAVMGAPVPKWLGKLLALGKDAVDAAGDKLGGEDDA